MKYTIRYTYDSITFHEWILDLSIFATLSVALKNFETNHPTATVQKIVKEN